MFDAYARRAGERSFRDFFRLPSTKENRSQLVDPACSAYEFVEQVSGLAGMREVTRKSPTADFESSMRIMPSRLKRNHVMESWARTVLWR
jgi:hypothetical protein